MAFILLFLYTLNCHAEGQDGLSEIANVINLVYSIGILICIACYIVISRIILKSVLNQKTIMLYGKKINNSGLLTTFVITFLSAVFLGLILWLYYSV